MLGTHSDPSTVLLDLQGCELGDKQFGKVPRLAAAHGRAEHAMLAAWVKAAMAQSERGG